MNYSTTTYRSKEDQELIDSLMDEIDDLREENIYLKDEIGFLERDRTIPRG